MNSHIYKYTTSKNSLLSYFGVSEDYHIRVCAAHKWRIEYNEGVCFLTYQASGEDPVAAVIARKNGEPIILRTPDLTLVVAIDCIKIAFILNNSCEDK